MRRHRSKRFVDLPRHKRADKVFDLKHEIKKGDYPGFLCHEVLDGKGSWSDVYFVGNDKFTFWNATLITPSDERSEKLWDKAWEVVDEQCPQPFEGGLSEWLEQSRMPIASFDGRTRVEEAKRLVDQWWDDRQLFPVYAKAEIVTSYSYGIGLHAVIDEPYITIDAINRFIDAFRSAGEKPYVQEQQVAWDVVSIRPRMSNAIL